MFSRNVHCDRTPLADADRPADNLSRADNYHGALREAAVCLHSKLKIQDKAYNQELSRYPMTVS